MAAATRTHIQALRQRLAELERRPASPLRETLQKLRRGPVIREGLSLPDWLEGEWVHRPSGEVLVVDRRYPIHHRHGKLALESLCGVSARAVSQLAGEDSGFAPARTLFLDTECTGLSGGAGTCVFLVGVGWVEEDEFHIRQLFLPNFESEKPFLEELITLAGKDFTTLVTFNGKSFDLNLLANRFTLQRLREPFSRLHHLDLLFSSRVLWRNRLESCSLQTLERKVLGFQRQEDIPSALIPRTYFDYLRGGSCRPFRKVLEHNRLDLLSMVPLLALLARLIESPDPEYEVDPLSTARLCLLRGARHKAARVLESSRSSARWARLRSEMTRELAWIRKRSGQTRQALVLWQEMIEEHPRPPLEAFREAAKILEHRERSLEPALRLVDRALELYPESQELLHRRHRLRCRLQGRRWY